VRRNLTGGLRSAHGSRGAPYLAVFGEMWETQTLIWVVEESGMAKAVKWSAVESRLARYGAPGAPYGRLLAAPGETRVIHAKQAGSFNLQNKPRLPLRPAFSRTIWSEILWREVIVRDETSRELRPGRSEGEEKPIRAKIFAMGGPSKSADRPFRLFAKTGSGRIYGKKALWMFVGKGSVPCAHS
jgi:hypothetical protein